MRGQLNEAMTDLDTVIRLNPYYAPAYYNRAIVMRRLGRILEAKLDYRTALKLAEQARDVALQERIKQVLRAFEE